MGGIQSRNSLDKEAEINTRAGDKKRMKKIDKDIRKTFFFDKDMVASKIDFDLNWHVHPEKQMSKYFHRS